MVGTKVRVLEKLKLQRLELDNQISLIEGLEVRCVTEQEWHELCLTPLRSNELLLDIAKATFKGGTNFKKTPNEVIFTLNDFKVTVPTTLNKGVTIDMGWYNPNIFNDYKPINRYDKMRRYFELLDSGNYKWYELAECRSRMELTRLRLFLWWFFKAKWHKVNRKEWDKVLLSEDTQNAENIKAHKEKQDAMKVKIKEFHKVVDILKEWGEVKGSVKQDGGFYRITNIENYLR